MKNNILRNKIARFIKVNFVLTLALFFVQNAFAEPVRLIVKNESIIGVWQLKSAVKTKRSKLLNSFLPVQETPESLILAVEEGFDEVTINEGFKEFIQTQTLPTDGQIVSTTFKQIGKVTTKARWRNGRLMIEMMTSKGDRIIETFELSSKDNLLNVSLQITEAKSGRTNRVRRVYERISDIDTGNTEEIGITVYPF